MSTDVEPYAAAARDAATRGLAVSFVARTPGKRPAPVDGVELVKTIVVQTKRGFVLVLTPVDAQFSWAKLRAHLGVNKLSLPDADGALAATGYVRGTITPLGAAGSWPVVLDARLAGRRIAIGSGSAEFGALVAADELVDAYSAAVVDLAAE
ncbi:aminoacyl-tRNA deacylase [Leucobacter chromiiresistens]|uniref:YbaK/ebsC protein n=1 Tax=Leucobacter chromiiresistens TaxID=1079994 RepID=A0A147ENS1_9MICO|nr:YbaK/EbsC family protein [Leucobacter chromiiresistens]KTR86131.1 ybaK/ebsC protein [Leucobacter chromiiresistens]